jgi:hypothetical protein
MQEFWIAGIPESVAAEVRSSGQSPGYGHPVVREVARGTGPCRSCLGLFAVGKEERLLFTYRPPSGGGTIGAPGPVFIHAAACPRYEGRSFPEGLRSLPLLFEARGDGGRILATETATGAVEPAIERLFGLEETEYLFVRHAEAGCYISRIERAEVPEGVAGGPAGR